MSLIVGLGNPDKYKGTRHNIGKRIVRKFAKDFYFPEFKNNKVFLSKTSKKKNTVLALPKTFINNSGKAVKKLTDQFIKDSLNNLWVVHDDLDLPLGELRISQDSSSGGHNGVKSIINKIGKDFTRFRIGIKTKDLGVIPAKDFVLQKFSKKEKKQINKTVKKTVEAIDFSLDKGVNSAMQKYN